MLYVYFFLNIQFAALEVLRDHKHAAYRMRASIHYKNISNTELIYMHVGVERNVVDFHTSLVHISLLSSPTFLACQPTVLCRNLLVV